ncbi:MAG: preprotein translocase subunit SecA [Gammaproteobacteria bacterium]|nr:preprotein translocase subunit SecA [Gammaproteobacteria bacterium]
MFASLVRKFFGSRNQRTLKRHWRTVVKINDLEAALQDADDAQLRERAEQYRARLAEGEAMDALLPEVFALVREAARRTLDMRHFDVQLLGGIVLHEGGIAEMRTGEGKTLVATLPACLHALAGESVHVVTVNDYLARRDADWMRPIYEQLGLTVGVIVQGLDGAQRRDAYASGVTYGTNNEFGFDYLRDNMVFRDEHRVMRGQEFAIVDEVDSILIDEARTPLIISGPSEDRTDLYQKMNQMVRHLEPQEEEDGPGDYRIDEKARQAYLTEDGHHRVEQLLSTEGLIPPGGSLYEAGNIRLLHHVNASLRARTLFQRDRDYIVSEEGKIVIIDEFTGRKMPGRRWSDGLHQAVEAKEGVAVETENQTVASITFQNYFRLYSRLSGMTGTADTEAYEFQEIYGLEVVVVPTHMPMVRDDLGDMVFLTAEEKYQAVVEDIQDCVERGQPVLVGTTSISNSELLSGLLQKAEIKHQVLNAKFHEQESHIIAQAGRPGTVTIATNMAGRGTDIVLGGALEAAPESEIPEPKDSARDEWQTRHDQVVAAGGLHIIGTERHESRRVDNQLRGRSGRQGDPGSSRFYLSLEDSLIRIFASERMSTLMQRLGMKEGEVIEHPWVTKAIGNAQRKVEARNFDIRKHLLDFDDVINDQRTLVYQQRNEIMESQDLSEHVASICTDVVTRVYRDYIPAESMEEQWNTEGLEQALVETFGLSMPVRDWLEQEPELNDTTLDERLHVAVEQKLRDKEEEITPQAMRQLEGDLLLTTLDMHWKEHLAMMDHLRQGIGLRSYAQKNPKQEYKREAFELFQSMMDRIEHDLIRLLCLLRLGSPDELDTLEKPSTPVSDLDYRHASGEEVSPVRSEQPPPQAQAPSASFAPPPTVRRSASKVGRNQPCPCGSGKKYKHCCGAQSRRVA